MAHGDGAFLASRSARENAGTAATPLTNVARVTAPLHKVPGPSVAQCRRRSHMLTIVSLELEMAAMTGKFELNEELRRKMFAEAIAMRKLAVMQAETIANTCMMLHAREVAAAVAAALDAIEPLPPQVLGSVRRFLHATRRGRLVKEYFEGLVEVLVQYNMRHHEANIDDREANHSN